MTFQNLKLDSFGNKNSFSRIRINISRTSLLCIFQYETAKRRFVLIGVKIGRVQRGFKMFFFCIFALCIWPRNERKSAAGS